MPLAFVMVNIEPGTEAKVDKQLRNVKNAKEVCFLYGIYDFIVRVESDSIEDLRNNISNIRRLENIRSTLTMTVAE